MKKNRHQVTERQAERMNRLLHKRRPISVIVDARGWSRSAMYTEAYCVAMQYPRRQSVRWNVKEDRKLIEAYQWGATVPEIAADHQRTLGAIRSRLGLHLPTFYAEDAARHLNSQQATQGNSHEGTRTGSSEIPSSLGRPARVSHTGLHPQP